MTPLEDIRLLCKNNDVTTIKQFFSKENILSIFLYACNYNNIEILDLLLVDSPSIDKSFINFAIKHATFNCNKTIVDRLKYNLIYGK
jgi:hypothetical protein